MMTREEYEKELIRVGFKKEENELSIKIGRLYYYELPLEIQEDDDEEDIKPKIVLERDPFLGAVFKLYTGYCSLNLDVETPLEAIEFANKIISIEPIF